MRLVLLPAALFAALAFAPAAGAQSPTEAPGAASAVKPSPDPLLAPYAGTWETAVYDTPLGTVGGTLTVAMDGTGEITITEMNVKSAPLTDAKGTTGALVATTTFFSSVAGQQFACTVTLAPAADGTLAGTIDAGTGGTFRMTARRAAP